MANDWDEEVLPSSPVLLVFLARPSIGPSRAFLNAPSPLSESGIRGLDERRWSIMTPNWSKPWKLWSTPILGAIRCPRYGGPVRVHACCVSGDTKTDPPGDTK